MFHRLLVAVYERITRKPYYTVRQASVEFGPSPAKVHASEIEAVYAALGEEAAHELWVGFKADHAKRRAAGPQIPVRSGRR